MKSQDYILLQKFVLNKCNPSEAKAAGELLQTQEGMEHYMTLLNRSNPSTSSFPVNDTEQESKDLIYSRLKDSMGKKPEKPVYQMNQWRNRAAVLIGLFAVSFLLYRLSPSKQENPGSVDTDIALIQTKSNPAGKKSKIHLADGSTVWLNSDSKLSYPEAFSGDKREIWLEGEAFFEVFRDEDKPFLVHTGKVTTRVLGTSFNINSFDMEEDIAVTVLSGKVQVAVYDSVADSHSHKAILLPGEQVSYDKKEETMNVGKVDESQIAIWKEKTLLFNKEPFAKVILMLERWYGVEIENLNPATNSCFVHGKYTNESLENVLTSLQYALGFEYEIDSKTKKITIKGGNCQN